MAVCAGHGASDLLTSCVDLCTRASCLLRAACLPALSTLTGDLAGLSERLDEVKGSTDERGNSMTDTSPLVKIKRALQQMKVRARVRTSGWPGGRTLFF